MKALVIAVLLFSLVGFVVVRHPDLAAAPLRLSHQMLGTERADIVFVGDLMFDRYIRTVLERSGAAYVLGDAASVLEADFTVGNLEGPITEYPSLSQQTEVGNINNMRFTFATSVPSILKEYGFDLVSIGNNHMLDFGPEGVAATKYWLSTSGISSVGDPLAEAPDIVTKDIHGIRVSFVAYNDFFSPDAKDTEEAIRVAKETERPDAIVVLAHWGEEYVPEPPAYIKDIAHTFIDAGATLVIGTHPHVIQPFEDYGAGRIYYSLGNFVFDQYWNKEVRCGLVVVAHFVKEHGIVSLSFSEASIQMKNTGQTVPGCT